MMYRGQRSRTTTTTATVTTTTTRTLLLVLLPLLTFHSSTPLVTAQSSIAQGVPFVRDGFNATTTIFNQADFCLRTGAVAADGTQIKDKASCSNTIQGAIPSIDKMVSTIIVAPKNRAKIPLNTPVTFSVKTRGMQLGFFLEPNSLYYSSPQVLSARGEIIGHQHIVAQRIEQPGVPLDPRVFHFFKGLEKTPDASGLLSAEFPEGFNQTGTYRVCSITGTRSHQPVIMPVAKRGSQDDCIRVEVVAEGGQIVGGGGAAAQSAAPVDPNVGLGGANAANAKNVKNADGTPCETVTVEVFVTPSA